MSKRLFIALLAAALLAPGCSVPTTHRAQLLTATGTSTVDPLSLASMPFVTHFTDGTGHGDLFRAGASEYGVLQSRSELEAFVTRHSWLKSLEDPMGIAAGRLPQHLPTVDFQTHQVIAFFDGAVKVGATSRIVAIEDQPGQLLVHTMRWEPPQNPQSKDDDKGRVHLVLVPRTDKAVSFMAPRVNNEVSSNGDGVQAGGNPTMWPRWKAVPNPEVTREQIDMMIRRQQQGASFTQFSLEKRTLKWIAANLISDYDQQSQFTLDSEVWVAILEGDLVFNGPGAGFPGKGQVGGTAPRASRIVMVISPEDMGIMTSMTKPVPGAPGLRFQLQPSGNLQIGDVLRFQVTGTPVDGSLTMTLTAEATGRTQVEELPYRALEHFALGIDPTILSILADVPVQKLTIALAYENSRESHEVLVVRDRDAQPTPPLRAAGVGDPGAYGAPLGQAMLDAFARDVAEMDWKGQDLTLTSREGDVAAFQLGTPWAEQLPAGVRLREYEIRGKFPKYVLPASVSGTGTADAFAPTRLIVILTDSNPIHVVRMQAFPQ